MNLGRFHAAIHYLNNEFQELNIAQLLAQIQAALLQSINTPNASTAEAFKASYAKAIVALSEAPSNATFPTRKKIFEDIGADGFIGNGLANKITSLFSENQITPANALVEFQKLVQQIEQFYKRITILDDTFGVMELEYDDLEPGQFEIGLSLPRSVVGSDIESLEHEFHEVNFVLKTLQEVVGEGVGGIEVKTISASEWQIYLEAVPILAASLVHAVEKIVALYKSNLEIKKLKRELENINLPEAVLKPLQDHIESAVKNEIRKIADELVEQYFKKKDEGRKNELKNQTSQALRYLADRIDRGATIEVHAEPPEEPVEEGEAENPKAKREDAKKAAELRDLVTMVNEKMSSVTQLSRSDQPVLAIEYDKNDKKK